MLVCAIFLWGPDTKRLGFRVVEEESLLLAICWLQKVRVTGVTGLSLRLRATLNPKRCGVGFVVAFRAYGLCRAAIQLPFSYPLLTI